MNVSVYEMITLTEMMLNSAAGTAGMSSGHGYAEVSQHSLLQKFFKNK